MIYNERQYKITLKQIENFREALKNIGADNEPEWLVTVQSDAMKSRA